MSWLTNAESRQDKMQRFGNKVIVGVLLVAAAELLIPSSAWAVPSYSRRYGIECSGCHTMWGALNGAGVQFRLSGYRAIGAHDLSPREKDVELSKGDLNLPSWLPLSFVTGVGYDYRSEKRTPSAASGNSPSTSKGSSLAIEDASIFLTGPIGNHLSYFIEFPMYETKSWEFTPSGVAEANASKGKNFSFTTETPTFEVAKFWWNNVLGDSAPRDSFNVLAGISHPPLAYSPGKVRLSVNQYPIYERRALDLISPKGTSFLSTEQDDSLFRLSEPQGFVEVNGMVVPSGELTKVGKKETFWFEYHVGVSNGSNAKADNNADKDLYGRFVMRWYGQSLGLFDYHSPNTYGSDIREAGSAPAAGVMNAGDFKNSTNRFGVDMTLSGVPYGVPLWLENQYMDNNEGNPTGYGTKFKWKGGFHQLNWQIDKKNIAYGRYDWLKGDTFNDGHNPAVNPKEWDYVLGFQHLVQQNMKVVGEYRQHTFEDQGPTPSKLKDDGFTVRMMFGF